jgi:F-type H+-transporting ATPase subunit epsilon
MSMPYWRAAGMTYVGYANACAVLVRKCMKEPFKSQTATRERVHFKLSQWLDGVAQPPSKLIPPLLLLLLIVIMLSSSSSYCYYFLIFFLLLLCSYLHLLLLLIVIILSSSSYCYYALIFFFLLLLFSHLLLLIVIMLSSSSFVLLCKNISSFFFFFFALQSIICCCSSFPPPPPRLLITPIPIGRESRCLFLGVGRFVLGEFLHFFQPKNMNSTHRKGFCGGGGGRMGITNCHIFQIINYHQITIITKFLKQVPNT